MKYLCVGIIFMLIFENFALQNGLAKTPPMGWMSWTRFFCEIDCVNHPNDCINEQLYMQMADRMVSDGYLDAGYEFVHIDDCWMANERDSNGKLIPNATRFPSGIPALVDYMHHRGLKLGIYEDYGYYTCEGYPGSYGHIEMDAQTFAAWNVDYLKFDGCNIDTNLMPIGYPEMSQALLNSGQPIVYSCSWPAYLVDHPEMVNYTVIGQACNLWRNYVPDIRPNWDSILGIIDYYTENQDKLIAANGPGQWNDPDMGGLTSVYVKKMTPCNTVLDICSYAIAILNKSTKIPVTASIKFEYLGLTYEFGYNVIELWDGRDKGIFYPNMTYSPVVPSTGVHLIKATPMLFGNVQEENGGSTQEEKWDEENRLNSKNNEEFNNLDKLFRNCNRCK